MSNKQLPYLLFFMLISSRLFGQANFEFKFKNASDHQTRITTDIHLHYPDNRIERLLSDTLSQLEYSKINHFSDSGTYRLSTRIINNGIVKDSIDYPFELNGSETNVQISLYLCQLNNSAIRQKGNKAKDTYAYLSVIKHGVSPKAIKLKAICLKLEKSECDIKPPYFRLTNYSKDTLYGEYMNGIFWGTLAKRTNDTAWGIKQTGIIDLNFVDYPPLSPDSSTIATVGSWGIFRELQKGEYKYELLVSTKREPLEYIKYTDTENTEWWIKAADFYQLTYEFKVE